MRGGSRLGSPVAAAPVQASAGTKSFAEAVSGPAGLGGPILVQVDKGR